MSILTLILLSRYEPMKTMFRITEQHDLGKLAFAFVMLNIYLTFAEFLIIWSGNVPDEIPWYLHRIHGGWWGDLLAGRDLPLDHSVLPAAVARHQALQAQDDLLCAFMLVARLIDMFWLIEPNFKTRRVTCTSPAILEFSRT